ncbi:ribosome small subunit-dependent GTPase A [Jeotgalibacillus sp. ET6]|uniref:ribosome small subunit-dependent GTPase A n=1 Tax=Jeotgalibacillus sp. ET6 TaxID=3037260 RepID=UPI0024188404|nr:ribosome small subunit-dependent GTPase A [Jeotgalibacillus sp. ET6]MDG5472915.1 ribosome small subunit-dependent GTPase A [Jeotgalibacillus sp. ET6]
MNLIQNESLVRIGWNKVWQEKAEGYPALVPGRIVVEHKRLYRIETASGLLLGEVSGKFRHTAGEREDYPAVGDWVMLTPFQGEEKAIIHAILPRVSKFSRKMAGETSGEQIVAVNIDVVFLVMALNQDFNLRRLERYLLSTWESGATPVVVLSKSDLCEEEEIKDKVQQGETAALGVPIIACSTINGNGVSRLLEHINEGTTVAVMGSSGVGKSSIINSLMQEDRMATHEIREGDDRGKHTTTHRELLSLPTGGVMIDTPGMRELQLWESEGGLEHGFQDIERLARECQFRDCKHENEPGCAVAAAIEEGSLDADRLASYRKLQKELAYMERKSNKREQLIEKKKWKKISQSQKNMRK